MNTAYPRISGLRKLPLAVKKKMRLLLIETLKKAHFTEGPKIVCL